MHYARYWDPHGNELELLEWARMFESRKEGDSSWWLVGSTSIGDAHVSTVWVGMELELRYDRERPLFFESMVFGGKLDQETRRYSSWDEAAAGHAELVELVRLEQAAAAE